jgi:lipoprotein-anchoring transpeptidase ErfK/SrfK
MATGKLEPLKAKDRSLNSFWRIAVLTVAGAIGVASQADATIYWPESDLGFSQPAPEAASPSPRRKKIHHHSEGRSESKSERRSKKAPKEVEAQGKDLPKPNGPLVIAISINQQNMKIYDTNGFFAETPISTGMRGHPTPMGVFSVIAKEKLHHSNIYSGAPMPFMQRITWSGIAIHAGVLPGYPASHGCIRMPMAFAVKMYGWTKMGARVVITPDEMVPSEFSHPLLVAQKIAPQPVAADEPKADAPPAAKADKAANVVTTKPASSEASLELRSTVGHDNGAKSLTDAVPASTLLREQTRTADASAFPITKSLVAMSDATASGDHLAAREQPVVRTDNAPSTSDNAASVKSGDLPSAEAVKSGPASLETESATAERAEVASADDRKVDAKPSDAKSSQAASAEITSADMNADKAGKKPDQADAVVPASDDAAKADDAKTAAMKVDAPKPTAKPEDSVKAATDVARVPDQKKDQGRLPGTEKAPAAKPDTAAAAPPKRAGQIAVFISRKDSKLYVRQNFAPLFDVPVTIAPSDRPLGTHVFTAEVDKDDANVLHWSVVSLPAPTRNAERRDEDERASHRRKMAGAVEMKAPAPEPDSPAEALDRVTIPADAKARIVEALSTGSSIIVSDQGIAGGETGEGTDFIVSLR